jgi:hypothetical protein
VAARVRSGDAHSLHSRRALDRCALGRYAGDPHGACGARVRAAGRQEFKGPTTWNGIQVYERLNRDKLQLFAIRDDRTGLGRVFDSRYPQLGCLGEVKFPLGYWKQGEVREYQLDCARGKRPLKVTIEEIDFVYEDVPHSLRFHWLFMEGRGRGTDMRYVYSPLRGLVDVQGNE